MNINVTFGSPRLSGASSHGTTRSNAAAGDMTIIITNPTNIKTTGAFLAACQSIANDLKSDGTLK